MKKLLFFFIVAAISGTGCKKDRDCKFNSENIQGSYKIVSIVSREDASSPEEDELAYLDACERDDILHFNDGGIYLLEDAGEICTPSNSFGSTWAISGNNLIVNTELFEVENFSCSGFTLTQTESDGGYYKVKLTED